MNMKLSSHGFLFHGNINERESKAQIPINIHNYEKANIFLMCRKIVELSKLVKWL